MGATVNTQFLNMFTEDWFLLSDMADFICGAFIGAGCSRSVYEFNLDPKLVIKIERNGFINNVNEWEIWTNLKDDKRFQSFWHRVTGFHHVGEFFFRKRQNPSPSNNAQKKSQTSSVTSRFRTGEP